MVVAKVAQFAYGWSVSWWVVLGIFSWLLGMYQLWGNWNIVGAIVGMMVFPLVALVTPMVLGLNGLGWEVAWFVYGVGGISFLAGWILDKFADGFIEMGQVVWGLLIGGVIMVGWIVLSVQRV